MALEEYKRKRDFKKTPEPEGKVARTDAKERFFCVQKHRPATCTTTSAWSTTACCCHGLLRRGCRSIRRRSARDEGRGSSRRLRRVRRRDPRIRRRHRDAVDVDSRNRRRGRRVEERRSEIHADWLQAEGILGARRTGGRTPDRVVVAGAGPRIGDARSWLLIKHRDDWAGEVDITSSRRRASRATATSSILGEAPAVWVSSASAGRRGWRHARQDHRARREPESQPHGAGVQESGGTSAGGKKENARAKK